MNEKKIRKSLLSRRAELLGLAEERDEAAAAVTIDDEEDKIFERLDDEVLAALSGSDRAEVARIDAALQKLADGTYGICAECGEKIAPARLEAVPDAVLCIDCASKA